MEVGLHSSSYFFFQPYAKTILTSDIPPGNILLRLPAKFDQLSIEQLYEKYG